MPNKFHRDRFTWLAYILLAFFAYFLNILGPITPFLKEELKLSYTVSSLHLTAFATGLLLIGFFGELIVKQIGRKTSLWVGAFGISLSAIALILGRSPMITIAASLAMGVTGSLILINVPSALSDLHGEQRSIAISEANLTASLVSVAAPLMVGLCAALVGGWRMALLIGALIPLFLRLGFGRAEPPPMSAEAGAQVSSKQPLPALFWLYWAAIVVAVSIEFCMIFWGADYMEKILGMQKANAAQAVSLFLAGMIIGRMAGSRIIQRYPIRSVVIISIFIAGGGFLIFWASSNAIVGMTGLFLTGLGVANMYPLILSLALGAAKDNAILASARTTLASGAALFALPLILGRLADAVGIRLAYGVVAALLVAIFLIILIPRRQATPQSSL